MHEAIYDLTNKNKQYCTEIVLFQTRYCVLQTNKKWSRFNTCFYENHDISIFSTDYLFRNYLFIYMENES